jgi:hypothetical protein
MNTIGKAEKILERTWPEISDICDHEHSILCQWVPSCWDMCEKTRSSEMFLKVKERKVLFSSILLWIWKFQPSSIAILYPREKSRFPTN